MAGVHAQRLVIATMLSLAACSPSTSPTPAVSAGPTEGPQRAELVIGCASIGEAECRVAAGRVLAELPPGRGGPFDVQISLGSCPNEVPCLQTVEARGGFAFVEYAGGVVDNLAYSLGGEPDVLGPLDFTFSGAIEPSSPRVGGPGPFPFDLGHCGLNHVVDFDGSFWVPIGEVDGQASGFLNSESGRIGLLGPNLAQYLGQDGFVARLARFPGAKRFFLCD